MKNYFFLILSSCFIQVFEPYPSVLRLLFITPRFKQTKPLKTILVFSPTAIAPARMSKSKTATARLKQDLLRLKKDPVPYVLAEPLPSNILEWHYVVTGPEASPYEGGCYHGKLVFPPQYPFKPPTIYMITPNGRFKPNTKLCLSMSSFHPETWNPAWSVSTILTALLSFMLEKTPTQGSLETTEAEKRLLAEQSVSFNLENKIFKELFPDLVEKLKEAKEKAPDASSSIPKVSDDCEESASESIKKISIQTED